MQSLFAPGTLILERGGEALRFPITHATAVDVAGDGCVGLRLDLRTQVRPVTFGGVYLGWEMAPHAVIILWGWTATMVQAGTTVVQPGDAEDRAADDATIYTGQHQPLEQNTLTIVQRDQDGIDVQWTATIADIIDPIHAPRNTITIQARFMWEE